MAKTLGKYAVHLRNDKGELHAFLPGEEVPEWAAKLMGDHCFDGYDWDADKQSGEPDSGQAPDGSGQVPEGPPPRKGVGSGEKPWTDYANSHNVELAPGLTRDEIIAACEDAGIPT